jgi:flagellar hook-length control protein FliK
MLANEGGGTARIQLFPPQLGGLELRVTVNQGAVQLSIVADRAAIADLMQHHLPELRHALQLPGLAVERVEIAHRESNLTEGERDTRPHGDGVEREDSSEPREQSGREEEGSPGVESWTGADGLDPISSRGSELQRVTSLGTVDVRA